MQPEKNPNKGSAEQFNQARLPKVVMDRTVSGSDARVFAAISAAQQGLPLIVIVTDAGHHDHPAFALVDYLGWNKPISLGASTLFITEAIMKNGVKDWGASLAGIGNLFLK